MKQIPLSKGHYALVDDEDFELVNQWKWSYHSRGYASRDGHRVLMHRLVLKAPAGIPVDHKNGDKLDNRRSNLRLCTPSGNSANSRRSTRNTSGFRGVYWHKGAEKWMAYINVRGQRKHLGLFVDVREAAEAYNKAALTFFGDFARVNPLEA